MEFLFVHPGMKGKQFHPGAKMKSRRQSVVRLRERSSHLGTRKGIVFT